jgi:hypothetical protein
MELIAGLIVGVAAGIWLSVTAWTEIEKDRRKGVPFESGDKIYKYAEQAVAPRE